MAVFLYITYKKCCLCRSLGASSSRKKNVWEHSPQHFMQPMSSSHVSLAGGFAHLSSLSLYSSVLLHNNLIRIKPERAPVFYLINPDATQKLALFDNHPTAAADLCMDPYDLCRALQQHCSLDTYDEQPLQHPAPAVQHMFLPSLLFSAVSSHLSFIISKNTDRTTQRHTSHFYQSGISRLHLSF